MLLYYKSVDFACAGRILLVDLANINPGQVGTSDTKIKISGMIV